MGKVSIIVPIYNVEKYLKKCIDSIVSQTYSNIEIILINDGSSDNSESICKEYESIDQRIRYYKKQNGGLSSARNYGIENATGDYLLFIDSDDYIDNSMVETLLVSAEKYNADMVECNYYEVINEEFHVFKPKKNKVYSSKEAIASLIYNTGITPTAWNKLYSKKLFSKLRYTEGLYHEDEEIIVKLLSKAEKVVEIGNPLYFYIKREGSIINSKFNFKHLDAIKIMEERIELLKKINMDISIISLAQARLSNIYNEMYAKVSFSNDEDLKEKKNELAKKRKNQIKLVIKSPLRFNKKIRAMIFYLFPKFTTKYLKGR